MVSVEGVYKASAEEVYKACCDSISLYGLVF